MLSQKGFTEATESSSCMEMCTVCINLVMDMQEIIPSVGRCILGGSSYCLWELILC